MTKSNNARSTVKRALDVIKQPLIAIILALIIGAIVIYAAGESPLPVYGEMFSKSFIKPYYLLQTLTRSTPIILCALATAIAWRAGYINIGVEGQMIMGSFVATVCAIYLPGPSVLVMIVSVILGMAGGALYALIPTWLNYRYKVSLVISTLMMNYIASYITSYFVSFPLKDTSGDGLALQTVAIDEAMRFPKFHSSYTFNIGFIIAVVAVIAFVFVAKKTTFGYESKMTGLNPEFARYGGIKDKKVMFMTMAISGAIAAIAGTTEIFGVKYRFIDGMFTSTSYAWTGLMSALIASLHPIGMFFTSILLSGLQVGGQSIQRTIGIPLQIATLIQSSITLFVSVKIIFPSLRNRIRRRQSKKIPVVADNGGDE